MIDIRPEMRGRSKPDKQTAIGNNTHRDSLPAGKIVGSSGKSHEPVQEHKPEEKRHARSGHGHTA